MLPAVPPWLQLQSSKSRHLIRSPKTPAPITVGLRIFLPQPNFDRFKTPTPKCILYIRSVPAFTNRSISESSAFKRTPDAGYFSLHHSFAVYCTKITTACQCTFFARTRKAASRISKLPLKTYNCKSIQFGGH